MRMCSCVQPPLPRGASVYRFCWWRLPALIWAYRPFRYAKRSLLQPISIVNGLWWWRRSLTEETRANAEAIFSPGSAGGGAGCGGLYWAHTDRAVTTLGRNGSDYSASVIGAALDCMGVTIYTDVDGVLTADPRLVMNTRLLPGFSYAEAARLSWFGAKVLHPRTLIPIAHRNIPVRVRNTFRPHIRGTVVGPEGRQQSGAAAITVRRHLALITMESTDLFGAPENAGQVSPWRLARVRHPLPSVHRRAIISLLWSRSRRLKQL